MRWRVFAVPGVGVATVLLGLLSFGNLNDNLVYYMTPQEAVADRGEFADGRRFRLGGLVEQGSVERVPAGLSFTVVDAAGGLGVRVVHSGAPTQLFQEGVGVVVEGAWSDEEFASDTMIVKHDEEYEPRDEEPEASGFPPALAEP